RCCRMSASASARNSSMVFMSSPSDAEALGEELAVVRRTAEECLGCPSPLVVEMRRVLPGEADAAVDVDVLVGGLGERLGAVRLGEPRNDGKLVGALRGRPRAVVGGGPRRLGLDEHVGALVLDRLVTADEAPELDADLGVVDGHLEHLLGAAGLLCGERD